MSPHHYIKKRVFGHPAYDYWAIYRLPRGVRPGPRDKAVNSFASLPQCLAWLQRSHWNHRKVPHHG